MIFALLLGILESARVEASRLNMTIAANSSIDSLFSQYHKELWEDYRLLGLEYYTEEQLSDEMLGFLQPYIDADNWFPAKADGIEISDLVSLTDDNGLIFEAEVLDYMKYGIAAVIWDIADAELFESGITEGSAVDTVSELYNDHAKEASAIEYALENIADIITASETAVSNAKSAARDCKGTKFIKYAKEAITELKKIPSAVTDYEKKADAMSESLEASRSEFDLKKSSGEISETVWQSMEEQISEYESYVDEDGERRQAVSALTAASASNISFLEELIEEAEDIIDYINNWEPDDEDDELDEDRLWRPIVRSISNYSSPDIGCDYGIADKETESKLESIEALLKEDFLSFVLPSDAKLSSDTLELDEAPTNTVYSGTPVSRLELTDRLYMSAYIGSEMNYFGRGIYDDEDSMGTGGCEQEYILYGHDNDTDNLTDTVRTLIGIRTGLNLAYLYTDSSRRQSAMTLALEITGGLGLSPLAAVIQFFILGIWALGQGVMDVRHLLAGGRVPFMHTSDTFDLTLDGLLRLSTGSMDDEDPGTGNTGLNYNCYLMMLLFIGQDSAMDYRCMDIMHLSIRDGQSDFLMDYLAYSLTATVNIYALHMFSRPGIVKAFDSNNLLSGDYSMSISTSYSY